MQISLNEEEITNAVKAYALEKINIADNQDIMVDFVAGRGANGLSATLDIVRNAEVDPLPARKPAASKPRAVKPKDTKPEIVEEPVENTDEEDNEVDLDIEDSGDGQAEDEVDASEDSKQEAPKSASNKKSIFSKAS